MPETLSNSPMPKKPGHVSRRALLKAGTASMPVILTLQSGAALARSSNLVSAAPPGTRDPSTGDAICMDTSTLTPLSGGKYDLGPPTGYAQVNMMSDQQYYVTGTGKSDGPYTVDDVCASGGPFSYQNGGWHDIQVKQGIIISAGAYTSVSTNGLNEIVVNYLS